MNVVLATGGSGGHVFPALKTAILLRTQGHNIFLAGALGTVEQRLKNLGVSYHILEVEGLSLRTLPRFIKRMSDAVFESKKLLQRLSPDVVVGFGSYSSFPVLWAASRMKIPTMIHEQNVIPGKANRLSSMFVDRIAVTFNESRKIFPVHKTVRTGCPCNDERSSESRAEILKFYGLKEGVFTILVLGGSQGSKYLNEVFFESIPELGGVQVIHMTGKSDEQHYAQKYPSLGIPYYVKAFLDNIQSAYAVADLVIGRAGAASVCEIASLGLPSILVPYPFAHSHQKANARVLESVGAAIVIDQKDMNRKVLVNAVCQMIENGRTMNVKERVKEVFLSNPTQQLVKEILSLKR